MDLTEIEEEIKQKKQFAETEIKEEVLPEQNIVVAETTNRAEIQAVDNEFVQAMTNNEVAIQMARDGYNDIKNQKNIAKGIKKVAIDNTKTDIESAKIKVEDKKKNNKIKRQEIKNELYKLKQDKIYLEKESKHKLAMQRFNQRKEKYGDLLLRHCRKKVKNAEGKWEYQVDEKGDAIINMPNGFVLFWLIVFDSIVMFLNQTADIFGSLNKIVFKVFWIILIVVVLFIPPVREWLFGLIGLNLG